jgi:hypothetical protein
MAKHVLKNADVVVNSVNLSAWIRSVTLETSRPEVDVTAMGNTHQQFAPGIGDATITLEVYQDYAAAAVDATLYPLSSSESAFNVVIKPTSAAVSATNPSYTMSSLLYVTFRNAGTGITKATS